MTLTSSSPRKIVIGDVHGQYDGLMQLLGAIAPGADDRICFVGDLIDRGPKSAHVVDFVMNSPYECLLGNHEKMLLDIFSDGHLSQAALHGWLFSGGQATLASYQDFFGEAGIPQNHIDWIYQRPLYADWGDYWIVHAGVNPQLPLEAQTAQDFCWIREPFHAIDRPYFADKTIVTGHTITFTMPGVMPGNVARGEGWIDIDTGAYHPRSGWLSALDLTHQQVYQVHVYEPKLRVRSLEEASTPIQRDHIAIAH